MKNKMLKFALLFSLTGAIITGCNSNHSNSESKDSTHTDEMSQGMGTIQTDTLGADSLQQSEGMQGDTVR